jgi:hypothetical protein
VNSIQISSGLKQTTIAALILVTGSLVGCGSDLAVNPTSLGTNDEAVGEVQMPKAKLLESPRNFAAQKLTNEWVQLSWSVPSVTYEAVITLDGVEIARLSSKDGSYLDLMGKSEGQHVYGLSFVKGALSSREARVGVEVAADPGEDMPRTDDRPEDGR